MSCGSISATCQSSPTTIIENEWLKNAAKLIEKGKIDAARVVLLNEKIDLLNQRIAFKDSIITISGEKDSARLQIINTYKEELANLTSQRDIAVNEMKAQNKKFKRQKRKTVFAVVGTAAVATAVYLFILK